MKLSPFLIVLCSACTIQGADVHPDKFMSCVDMNSGEKFSFVGMKNVRIGVFGGNTCADIVTDKGQLRTLCKSQELYIKCVTT